MTQSEFTDIECRKCGRKNLKIFEDGSGYCLDCSDTFADVKEYTERPKYALQQSPTIQPLWELPPPPPMPPPIDKSKYYMKMGAIFVIILIVIGSIGYVSIKPPFNPTIIIDTTDRAFYTNYPSSLPINLLSVKSDVLWGDFNPYIDYSAIQTVQVTPTIQDLAQQFIDQYPKNVYERVEATYSFVASNTVYRNPNDVDGYQYPVTTLQTKRGACAETASLLASLLYAEGLNDVALVITNTTDVPHVYVAVKLPSSTEAVNSVEGTIRGYLGNSWIAMDSTNDLYGDHAPFRDLDSTWEAHYNIQTIVKVPVFGCVFEFEYSDFNDSQMGYCWNITTNLFAFEHIGDNDVSFTFQMYENDVLYSTHKIDVTSSDSLVTNSYSFYLDYNDNWSENDTWYFGLVIDP
jgi:hypothetical protein